LSEERRVTGKNPYFTFKAGKDHKIRLFGKNQAFRRDEF
jgi:hypothetical protein